MLSRQEQRVWDDVQRFWAAEVEEPPRVAPPAPSRRKRPSRDPADLPAAVVAGAWITVMLVLFGAVVAGLAIAVATALGWALWHVWPQLSRQGAPDTSRNSRKDRTRPGRRTSPGTGAHGGCGTPADRRPRATGDHRSVSRGEENDGQPPGSDRSPGPRRREG